VGDVLSKALAMLNDTQHLHRQVRAFLAESEQYRVLLAEPATTDFPGRWGVVLEGELKLVRGAGSRVYGRGDRFFVTREPAAPWKNLCRLF